MLEALDFVEVTSLPDNLPSNKGIMMYLAAQDRDYIPGMYYTDGTSWILFMRAANPRFKGTMLGPRYGEVVQNVTATTAATSIDLALGSYVVLTLNVATAVTFTNLPENGTAAGFTLEVIYGGRALTFTQTIKWPGKVAPVQTVNGTDVFPLYSRDGSTLIGGAMKDIG